MELIKPKFRIIQQGDTVEDIYKQIEYPGRICYGSTDRIGEGTAKKFVENTLMKSNHGAPMEHGTVYLECPKNVWDKYVNNPYSRTTYCKKENEDGPIVWINKKTTIGYISDTVHYYVSTNFRVLFENDWLDDLKYICEPTEYHVRRITVEFTCDLGVSREYNRHRKDSINEESTRYCNYSKEKFGGEVNIIEPNWLYDKEDEINLKLKKTDLKTYCLWINHNVDHLFNDIDYWLFANLACEWSYMNLIKLGWKPQQARTILPLDTKTTLIHTAFIDDWVNFFNLRAIGTTGAPHPQAKELAEPLMYEFIKQGYVDEDNFKKLKLNK